MRGSLSKSAWRNKASLQLTPRSYSFYASLTSIFTLTFTAQVKSSHNEISLQASVIDELEAAVQAAEKRAQDLEATMVSSLFLCVSLYVVYFRASHDLSHYCLQTRMSGQLLAAITSAGVIVVAWLWTSFVSSNGSALP